ncbi:MAG: VWA domain-containing protein [Pseudomonadota bacterium]
MRKLNYLIFVICLAICFSLGSLTSCKNKEKQKPAQSGTTQSKKIELPGPKTIEPAPEPVEPTQTEQTEPTQTEQKAAPTEPETLANLGAADIPTPVIEEVGKKQFPEVPFAPKLVDAKTNINIILDASGSQSAIYGITTQSKLDLQKKALFEVMLSLKDTEFPRNVGIRTFGSQTSLNDRDCADMRQLYPVSQPNLDKIKEVVLPLTAQGESPIAASLEAASNDFPAMTDVDQIIVLITDGSDTCQADPCQIAQTIHTQNPRTSIQVIGFDISSADQEKLSCIAKNSDGKFYLARNEEELRKSLDEAVSSKLPYNLRLNTVIGATPIPVTLTVYKSQTNEVVKTETSFGTKLLSLAPGTYDIMVEYTASPEFKKPSKIIKGVEILEKTKVEQKINFDLGAITLAAIDATGNPSPARFEIRKKGQPEIIAEARITDHPQQIYLPPGQYDITSEQEGAIPERIRLTESGVDIKTGESTLVKYLFQEGTLKLEGITSQKTEIPFIYQIYKTEKPDQIYVSGALTKSGGTVNVAPGNYDIVFIGQDPQMIISPRSKANAVSVKASEITEVLASFEMGLLTLSAVDTEGKLTDAEFDIRLMPKAESIAKVKFVATDKTITVPVPPDTYEILASKNILTTPKPTTLIPNVRIDATKPVEKVAQFSYGTLRVRGINSKEQPIETEFMIYRAGLDEPFGTANASSDWVVFELPQGFYNAKAINAETKDKIETTNWLKDIEIKNGKLISQESIFTTGKLKIIGRGSNNIIINCKFKVFEYGSDRELILGETGDDWQIYEIEPGDYYLEAGYVDPEASVLLKKWINIKVADNEILELILYF